MTYFEMIQQTPNLIPGGGDPDAVARTIVTVDPTNPNYSAAGPTYFTPSDTLGDGTEQRPYATLNKAVAMAGRAVDRQTVIRLHTVDYDPAAPATLGYAATTETGVWYIDQLGGKDSLFIVGDMIVNMDTNLVAAEGGTPTVGSAALLDTSAFAEGALFWDVPTATGWTGAYDAILDPNLEDAWMEWEDDGTGGDVAGIYRAKILAVDEVGGGVLTPRYFLQPFNANALTQTLNVKIGLGFVAGSLRIVRPGYQFTNTVGSLTTMFITSSETGRLVTDVALMAPPPVANVCLHGIKITNTAAGGHALSSNGICHGMLTLEAYNHYLYGGWVSLQFFDGGGATPYIDDVDASVRCGGCLYMKIMDATGDIHYAHLIGALNVAVRAMVAGANVQHGIGENATFLHHSVVYDAITPSVIVPALTLIHDGATVSFLGAVNFGQRFESVMGRFWFQSGDWGGGLVCGVTLSGSTVASSYRIQLLRDSFGKNVTSRICMEQPGISGWSAQGKSMQRVDNAPMTADGFWFVDETSEFINMTDGVITYHEYVVGLLTPSKPYMVNHGTVLNEGIWQCTGFAFAGPEDGLDFGNQIAWQNHRGAKFHQVASGANAFSIWNVNAGLTSVIDVAEGSEALMDISGSIIGTNTTPGVAATILVGTGAGALSPRVLAGAEFINDYPAGPTTGAEDTSVLRKIA